MTTIATCHCGGTRVELPDTPTHATSCTCTFCTKSGGLWAYHAPEAPRILSDAHRGEYTVSGFNLHYFCANCGARPTGYRPTGRSAARAFPKRGSSRSMSGCSTTST